MNQKMSTTRVRTIFFRLMVVGFTATVLMGAGSGGCNPNPDPSVCVAGVNRCAAPKECNSNTNQCEVPCTIENNCGDGEYCSNETLFCETDLEVNMVDAEGTWQTANTDSCQSDIPCWSNFDCYSHFKEQRSDADSILKWNCIQPAGLDQSNVDFNDPSQMGHCGCLRCESENDCVDADFTPYEPKCVYVRPGNTENHETYCIDN